MNRSQMIRKAGALPKGSPQRRKILASLRKKALTVGETVENEGIRIHRYRPSIRVWDLTNAGKRGKNVDIFVIYDLDMGTPDPTIDKLFERFFANLPKQTSYRRALAEAKMLVLQANDSGWRGPGLAESTQKGVRVAPSGFGPIQIEGKHVSVRADWNSFSFQDKGDRYNLPTCIPRSKGSKGDVKQFFRWAKDNERAIKSMTFEDVRHAMDAEGIGYHYYCAMD